MLLRDRVDLPVDPGTSFLELSLFAAYGLYGRDVHSASVRTISFRTSGRRTLLFKRDSGRVDDFVPSCAFSADELADVHGGGLAAH
jgi:hypothetical protein